MNVEDLLGVEPASVRAALDLIERTIQNPEEELSIAHLDDSEQKELLKGLCAGFCLWASRRIRSGSLSNFFKDLRRESLFLSRLGQPSISRTRVLDLLNCTSGYGASFYMQLDAFKDELLTNAIYDLIALFISCSRHSYGGKTSDNTLEACNRIRVFMIGREGTNNPDTKIDSKIYDA